jgi:dihydroorotate dehydrogenase (NAD+) catalytic subunit
MPTSSGERLAVRLGQLTLPNPVICGSGEPVMTEAGVRAALRAGAAGVIAKSVNEQEAAARQLDRADYLRMDETGSPIAWRAGGGGLFCRSGLSQREAGEWFSAVARLDRDAAAEGRFVGASVVLGSPEGAEALAREARRTGVRLLELNVGAPHASEARPGAIALETDPERLCALVTCVRAALGDAALWVKLTGLSTNLPALALAAREAGADAVVMMGRFMAIVPDLDSLAPHLGSSGAYGGPWAVPIVCRFLALSRRAAGPDFLLVGTNGVRTGTDAACMALAGASAVEMLSAVMLEGFGALTRVLTELDAALAERGLRLTDLVGRAADALGAYGDQPDRPGHWRDFVPRETLQP